MSKKIIKQLLAGLCSFLFIAFPLISSATVYTLYDETQNNLPDDQDWLIYANDGSASSTPVAAGVNLTTDNATSAGFSNSVLSPVNPGFPILDSSIGFTLSFSMQLISESHTANINRAGFSIILLDSNNQGVELGFWTDTIWSQNADPLFTTKDEEKAFNTTAGMLAYELTLFDNQYFLTHNETILLTGILKDYSAFTGGPFGSSIPYSLENYLFLGDDTSSAQADVILGRIEISDTALFSIPTPSTLLLIILGLLNLFLFSTRNSSPIKLINKIIRGFFSTPFAMTS